MNLVDLPLAAGGSITTRIMQIGQHLMAVLLTAIGVIRAMGDGVVVPLALGSGVVVLLWHTIGAVISARAKSNSFAIWWLVGLAGLWLAAVIISAEFVWIAFLLWLLAGHLLPLKWGVFFSIIVLIVTVTAPIVHHGATNYANIFGPAIGSVFAFVISRGYLQLLREAEERENLVGTLKRAQLEMTELQDELALAQRQSGMLAERTRISRDIHDTIAQSLSSIKLLAHAAGKKVGAESESKRTLKQIESLAGDSLADVRRIVAALVPAELEEGALVAALQRMLARLQEETGITAELLVDDRPPTITTAAEVALLRAAQSTISNIKLHAQATRVTVSFNDEPAGVTLRISDNGKGFDVKEWEEDAGAKTSSYGLRFMRERMQELGGDLQISSDQSAGTTVIMIVSRGLS